MRSRTNQKAAKHFGAIEGFSWTIRTSFGAMTAKSHEVKLRFVSKARLTAF
jgi:hypothetical protein